MSWCFLCGHFIDQTSLSSFFRCISAPTSSSRRPSTTSMSCRPSLTRHASRPGSRTSTSPTTNSAPSATPRWSSILSSFYGNVSKHTSPPTLSTQSGTTPVHSLTRNSISPTRIYIWSGSAITGLSQQKAGKPAFPCSWCSFLNWNRTGRLYRWKQPAYTGLFWRILWSQAWRSRLG